jgi:hypothetical protein
METMNKLEEIREKILPVLLPWGVERVALFGSVVKEEETPESDIDILVKLKPPSERPSLGLKWISLEQELSRILDREVDLVSESGLSPYIRPYIEKELVVLYEEG